MFGVGGKIEHATSTEGVVRIRGRNLHSICAEEIESGLSRRSTEGDREDRAGLTDTHLNIDMCVPPLATTCGEIQLCGGKCEKMQTANMTTQLDTSEDRC